MNVNGREPDYSLISKYRTVLMGIAIIFIMFCHMDVAQRHNGAAVTTLAKLLQTFTVGVDIFLFLSGVGLYYSYTKKQPPYVAFERKRLARVLPFYFAIGGAAYSLYDLFIKHLGIGKLFSDLFFISWFREGTTRYWYVLAIVVFYLLFPVLYHFVHGGKGGLLKTILFSICWFVAMGYICQQNAFINRFRIALERLPIFVFGIYCGKLSYEKVKVNRIVLSTSCILGYVALVVLKTIIPQPLYDYLYYPVRALLGISIITTVVILMEMIEGKTRAQYSSIKKGFSWFGGLTLELYLLHQSYMILLEFPYKLITYLTAAFVLPTITAGIISLVRMRTKPVKGRA